VQGRLQESKEEVQVQPKLWAYSQALVLAERAQQALVLGRVPRQVQQVQLVRPAQEWFQVLGQAPEQELVQAQVHLRLGKRKARTPEPLEERVQVLAGQGGQKGFGGQMLRGWGRWRRSR